ncbi:MAG: Ada metal-binding domain-containing protein [Chloroflexota bacterium]|nr:Ada metal-binding domain-containing protein [Chloroflexota bacterium]
MGREAACDCRSGPHGRRAAGRGGPGPALRGAHPVQAVLAPPSREATLLEGCRTTRIYCRPGCRAGIRMKPENRVSFRSADEARAAGYRACKVCKPDGALAAAVGR